MAPDEFGRAEAIRLYESGESMRKLAARFGVSRDRIRNALKGHVVIRDPQTKRRERAEAVRLYQSGLSSVKVGAILGISKSTVQKALAAAGVPMRNQGPMNSRRFDRDEAARLYRDGLSVYDVGTALGVTGSAVYRALVGLGVPMRTKRDDAKAKASE
jgi:predicted DNA-binding protein (UPF0251 family)